MTRQITSFIVEKPGGLLNMNDRGSHWERAGGHETWRNAAFWWAKQHRVRCRGATGPVEVWIEFGTKQPNRRRDPHNFFPTVKAICDGFTNACVWQDDDSKHVKTLEPTFTDTVPANSLRVTLAWLTDE